MLSRGKVGKGRVGLSWTSPGVIEDLNGVFQFYTGYEAYSILEKGSKYTVVQTNFNALLKRTKNAINLTGNSLSTTISPVEYTQF